ncbi:GTPase Era [Candidatus Acetothermia bacterium]|jgi:GTP-binding protein Era|nr:GTPase Era [Candidatus Acetothermia bacterium]MCI2427579.1 GTPase Era [Candidatus Acetothermia bacterium]MCI2428190.1 GTPase Era [Candidatus Acetothermia bacterium]
MESFSSGFVGVIGQTNVGKSTFVNAILGKKLVITSPKPQTTRNRIRCIYNCENVQIVFVDTPGLHRPHTKLSRHILRQAYRALRELDLILYMVEPWGKLSAYDTLLLDRLTDHDKPIILLVNKIDRASGNALEETLLAYARTDIFAKLIPISAQKGTNLTEALRTIIGYLPHRPAYFPVDMTTDQSEEFLVSELIREKIIQLTFQELPYSTAVRVKEIEQRSAASAHIRAEIYVARKSQRGIIIGKGGAMIKEIGTRARRDIEILLGTNVFLDLVVRIRKDWTEDKDEIEILTKEEIIL